VFASISSRWIGNTILFDSKVLELSSNENSFELIDITLYNNGRFLASTYNMSCQKEHVGHYTITNDTLYFNFNNDPSEYISETYIKHETQWYSADQKSILTQRSF
jgi:hypothetical protein